MDLVLGWKFFILVFINLKFSAPPPPLSKILRTPLTSGFPLQRRIRYRSTNWMLLSNELQTNYTKRDPKEGIKVTKLNEYLMD